MNELPEIMQVPVWWEPGCRSELPTVPKSRHKILHPDRKSLVRLGSDQHLPEDLDTAARAGESHYLPRSAHRFVTSLSSKRT